MLGVQFFWWRCSIHLALRKKLFVFFPLMTTMQKNTLPKTKVAPENGWVFSDNPFGVFPPRKSSGKILPQNDITRCVKLIRFIPGPLFPSQWIHKENGGGTQSCETGRIFWLEDFSLHLNSRITLDLALQWWAHSCATCQLVGFQ